MISAIGSGNFTLKTKIPTGSTSKWPSAMMFAGLVHDGTVPCSEIKKDDDVMGDSSAFHSE